MVNPRCFMDINVGDEAEGRIVVELYSDIVPKTAENFRALCTAEKGIGPHTGVPLHFKVWNYQTKGCIQTLKGHTHNVSAVCFHPELPIIITEDGTVRIWHATTYRLENTLNYGLERVWAFGYMKSSRSFGQLTLIRNGPDIRKDDDVQHLLLLLPTTTHMENQDRTRLLAEKKQINMTRGGPTIDKESYLSLQKPKDD